MQKWSFLGEISMIILYQVKRSGNQRNWIREGEIMRLWDLGIGDWEDWGSGDSGGWKDQGIGGSEGSRGGGLGGLGIRDQGSGIRDQGSGIFTLLLQLSFSQKLTNGGLGDWGSGDQGAGYLRYFYSYLFHRNLPNSDKEND